MNRAPSCTTSTRQPRTDRVQTTVLNGTVPVSMHHFRWSRSTRGCFLPTEAGHDGRRASTNLAAANADALAARRRERHSARSSQLTVVNRTLPGRWRRSWCHAQSSSPELPWRAWPARQRRSRRASGPLTPRNLRTRVWSGCRRPQWRGYPCSARRAQCRTRSTRTSVSHRLVMFTASNPMSSDESPKTP